MASHTPLAVIRPETDDSKRNAISGVFLLDDSSMAPPSTIKSASRIPSFLQFPLVAIISLSTNALLYTLIAEFAGFELAAVSRTYTEQWQVYAVVGWKVLELAFFWFGGYDTADVASLTLLANAPYYNLLDIFYRIDLVPILTAVVIDTLSSTLPFYLLRGSSDLHRPTNAYNTKAPGRALYSDGNVRVYLALLVAVVYGSVIWVCFQTIVPVYMAVHFDGIRTLERAHETQLVHIMSTFLPLGWQAREFLWTSATSTRLVRDHRPAAFDTTTSTFAETIRYQFEFFNLSPSGEVLVKRAGVLVLYTFVHAAVRVFSTIEGVDLPGAVRWAAIWATASAAASTALGLCGA